MEGWEYFLEVDVTDKLKYIVKYGLVSLILLSVLLAVGIWFYQNRGNVMRIYDARVSSTMVGVRVLASGKVQELAVSDGDHVEEGQMLARMEVNMTEEQLQQLEQTVELAKQNLAQVLQGQTITVPVFSGGGASPNAERARERMNRMQELFEMGAVSANQRDAAAAEYNAAAAAAPSVSYRTITQPSSPEAIQSAEISLRQAEASLAHAREDAQATEITAPVGGTVYMSDVQEGTEIRAGQTLLSIGDGGNIWLEARVTDEQLAKIHLGQFVTYELEGHELQGTIIEIQSKDAEESEEEAATEGDIPEEEDDGRTLVKISLPSQASFDYIPGMKAVVSVKL